MVNGTVKIIYKKGEPSDRLCLAMSHSVWFTPVLFLTLHSSGLEKTSDFQAS